LPFSGSSHARLAPPADMKHAIKLVDDNLSWCDSGMDVSGKYTHPNHLT